MKNTMDRPLELDDAGNPSAASLATLTKEQLSYWINERLNGRDPFIPFDASVASTPVDLIVDLVQSGEIESSLVKPILEGHFVRATSSENSSYLTNLFWLSTGIYDRNDTFRNEHATHSSLLSHLAALAMSLPFQNGGSSHNPKYWCVRFLCRFRMMDPDRFWNELYTSALTAFQSDSKLLSGESLLLYLGVILLGVSRQNLLHLPSLLVRYDKDIFAKMTFSHDLDPWFLHSFVFEALDKDLDEGTPAATLTGPFQLSAARMKSSLSEVVRNVLKLTLVVAEPEGDGSQLSPPTPDIEPKHTTEDDLTLPIDRSHLANWARQIRVATQPTRRLELSQRISETVWEAACRTGFDISEDSLTRWIPLQVAREKSYVVFSMLEAKTQAHLLASADFWCQVGEIFSVEGIDSFTETPTVRVSMKQLFSPSSSKPLNVQDKRHPLGSIFLRYQGIQDKQQINTFSRTVPS